MVPKHKLIGVKQDLSDLITKFKQSERINFGDSQVGVCIDSTHMETIVKILKQDIRDIDGVLEAM